MTIILFSTIIHFGRLKRFFFLQILLATIFTFINYVFFWCYEENITITLLFTCLPFVLLTDINYASYYTSKLYPQDLNRIMMAYYNLCIYCKYTFSVIVIVERNGDLNKILAQIKHSTYVCHHYEVQILRFSTTYHTNIREVDGYMFLLDPNYDSVFWIYFNISH